MVTKLIAVVACVILLLGLGATGLLKTGIQKKEVVKWEDKNSLKEIARRSKEEGRARVTVPGPWVRYPGMETKIDEALRDYSVVVAELIESKSYAVDSHGIGTWHKFRIIDALSERTPKYCPTCPEVAEAPQDFSVINRDEFLLATGGGTVDIDGVEVTEQDRLLPVFESGKKYLLVISLTPTRVAVLGAGPAGVFRLADDEKLEAVNELGYPIQAEISQRFAGKLSELKSHVKRYAEIREESRFRLIPTVLACPLPNGHSRIGRKYA